ncbi:hypothetical protein [Pollutimonas bauzanensis]|uniref:Cysteine rich repeat-containing protein n=1 Tax=Pollutimonas bauzanensis TaxID=658167 RepID=A0A1M5XQR0_9BURK|nr:hypothetical protein [Pollutimonas bauzanensis]SHI01868.1 hypothetical protein SAMN04488135_10763 [Pollutimonas bauzanensis]
MHTRSITLSRQLLAACALGACLAAPLAMAAGPGASPGNADIEARYKTDIARCNAGQTNQDKATCLREAGAARDESRRNRLSNGNQAYDKNEVARCQALPAAKRDDCMLQMSGQNTRTQGSVGGGGVLRETTITTPGAVAPAPVPAPPAPGLTPNPPPATPAPSLAPPAPPSVAPPAPLTPAAPVPGTGIAK